MSKKFANQQIKTILTSLCEKDLKKIFANFLEITHEKIQRQCKEISYKCFEATINMRNKAGVGFGRNQNEAIINGLRNLLESLLDDDQIVNILKECIKKSNEILSQNSVGKLSLPVQKQSKKQKSPVNKSPLNTTISEFSSKSKLKIPNCLKNLSIQSLKVQQIQNSKNSSILKDDSMKKLMQKTSYVSTKSLEQQLRQAKAEIVNLETNLKLTQDENKYLKELLFKKESLESKKNLLSSYNKSMTLTENKNMNKQNSKITLIQPSKIQISLMSQQNKPVLEHKKSSKKVPRLNLQILPNYHANSNKSLNQSLLAAYEQKQHKSKHQQKN